MKVKWADNGVERLKPNTACSVELTDGSIISVGVIRVEPDKLVYFNGKGLRDIWRPNMDDEENSTADRLQKVFKEPDGEEQLKLMGYISVTPLAQITRVLG